MRLTGWPMICPTVGIQRKHTNGIPTIRWLILKSSSVKEARQSYWKGDPDGSTRHCRHCTLRCIACSRRLCRLSLLRPLSGAPGTQSRRPSSLNGPRPFIRHLNISAEKVLLFIECLRFTQYLLGWKSCKYYGETGELPNPKPTQPKKK